MITIFISFFFWVIFFFFYIIKKCFDEIKKQREYEEAKRNEHKLTDEEIIEWFSWRDNI